MKVFVTDISNQKSEGQRFFSGLCASGTEPPAPAPTFPQKRKRG